MNGILCFATSGKKHSMSWNFNYYDYDKNDIHTSCSHHYKENCSGEYKIH
jgi:hypothetical protein